MTKLHSSYNISMHEKGKFQKYRHKQTISGICPKHGYYKGSDCKLCNSSDDKTTINIQTYEHYKGWYEHIDEKPIYIESRKQLARECEKRGSYAKALLKRNSQGSGHRHKV